ncbi:DedA family protein [Mycetocola reblochoni]|uniref:DedA-like protein n=2 Tax=Mycetocola reblochoni TaxID=331618 RepID=A0A1R4JEA8_9MICO|nr:DedA family protein [Mycetocola reblochoni]RLP69910.1 DedA family protein [Mycetocola reblochoni]SJN30319.1 DedA-like protein [Mycetocola reblochoni REB411]
MNDLLTWLLDAVQAVPALPRILIAAVAIMLETSVLIGLIVPGDSVVLVAATGVSSPPEGIALGAAVVCGALVGESIGFWLGWRFGPWIRRSALGRRLGEKNWVKAENYLQRRGGIAVFLSRFLPVLHSLIPLTVGMSKMRYRTFLAWTVPACVIWSAAYVGAGSLAATSFRALSREIHTAGYFFVGAIVVFIVVAALVKRLISWNERRHLEVPTDEH